MQPIQKRMKKARNIFVAVILLFTLGACTFFRAPGTDKCDKILDREQVADILADLYMLEAFLQEYQYIERESRDSVMYFYGGIFTYHEIDPVDFEEALDCYLLDAREMERIHEMLLNRLSLMESEAQSEKQRDKQEESEIPLP
ncbi:MAG: DUF4296 domain-containing protein [Bacteroidia bacterium]|nr:MAG: DUF4296 domain-containing protein [Bacteroidia bacterium]